jgi:hypothetical protein
MHGSGRLTFPDGVCFEGSFVADSISGRGVSDAVQLQSRHCAPGAWCLCNSSRCNDASAPSYGLQHAVQPLKSGLRVTIPP